MRWSTTLFALTLSVALLACAGGQVASGKSAYKWSEITSKAQFPIGYNYPVFVMDGELRAINNGGWTSKDGRSWTRTALPESGLNSAYQRYIQFNDSVYALGTMTGNYLDFKLTSKITRTRDFQKWEVLTEKSNLPERVFYGATVFNGKMWLFGGWDGKRYYNDSWTSADGVKWERIAESAPWSQRNPGNIVLFKDKLWLIGGGVIDGEKNPNPNSNNEIWTSADGINWTEVKPNTNRKINGSPIVFDGKLWMAGANRGNGFESGMLYTTDGVNWVEEKAPWSPRGGVAVWVFDDKLFLTGGKSSHTENGEIKFVYSNDVWAMERKSE